MWKTCLTLACASVSPFAWATPKAQTRLVAINSVSSADITPSVVQNRFFTKSLRAEVGLSAGTILNESYSRTASAGARAGLFFNELLGLEYNFAQFRSQDSVDLKALRTQEVCIATECRAIEPSFIRLEKSHQLQIVSAPIYGKINLFDWSILYSDLTFSAGAALVETSQGRRWAFTPGIGQRFYFSKSFSLRVDATDLYLRETLANKGTSTSQWRHNWVAQLGLSAFLNEGE